MYCSHSASCEVAIATGPVFWAFIDEDDMFCAGLLGCNGGREACVSSAYNQDITCSW